ncbi:5-formyltetrahydrofolate cyclo-ligase [Algoriphagus ratkowskyi]|uniref:5-formyltetrahydrofolate cyclo-ligase n=1 Tax=Algoriphagus ratkowskyi TaxID=57028 RepID=A0A2W7RGR4_9BACT|nr:5-formyltetrahydrofolate cyclo-ligase [Algoriphagus ratkowskyi]PZX54747.1 5-formyltetrahydrofolate cyclo-ligase [Algoriphagus ratkowskyi]TXD77053.1 5-formyltetrahydrofolate cyclo-ligase [Algoriphagus ratkowskyi]
MSLDKQQLRIFYKKLRAGLSDEDLEKKSLQILDNLIVFLKERKDLEHFHLFFPISKQREINTFLIKEFLEARKNTIYTSRVEADSLALQTLQLQPNTKFYLDKWGIPVPKDYLLVSNEMIQVVFVPLLAYDQKGNRIGFGKGYYDLFLSSLDSSVCKIGLSLFSAELHIPSELHDIPLDFCITPENILTF